MDITAFVIGKRDRSLGDYNTYRSQLSQNILTLRRRLKRTTPKNAKFANKTPVTAEDIAENHEYVHLLLVEAERAWAHAMYIKSTLTTDQASTSISGSARRHIISKLHKAHAIALHLVKQLHDRNTSQASDTDYLEAQAYALTLAGAEQFEQYSTKTYDEEQLRKEDWSKCLTYFSEAHIIYSALYSATRKEVFRGEIAGRVDTSIRYAAYQSGLSRTIPIPTVAKRNFRKEGEQAELVGVIKQLNPDAFREETPKDTESKPTEKGLENATRIPTQITWRDRIAPIPDASIGQAMAALTLVSTELLKTFTESKNTHKRKVSNSHKLSAAYDPVLTRAQDTVDAVRRSISDLQREGISESDQRMQDLRVSDLAVNYTLISWRIGRNRVLIAGPQQDDGLQFLEQMQRPPKGRRMSANESTASTRPRSRETKPRKLSRLNTRIVLYDSILQSLDGIKLLPGASRDQRFLDQLDGKRAYFQALKCLNIAYSHRIVGGKDGNKNALALYARAKEVLNAAAANGVETPEDANVDVDIVTADGDESTKPPTLTLYESQLQELHQHLDLLLLRQRGLVTLQNHTSQMLKQQNSADVQSSPLIDRLREYPASGKVDLKNIVRYPPTQLEPVPIKPIFLDLAWNYIQYPGHEIKDVEDQGHVNASAQKLESAAEVSNESKTQETKKRGWFGFGRG